MRHSLIPASCVLGMLVWGAVTIRGQDPVPQVSDEAAQNNNPIVPVHHEPHHRQVFQFGPTRILDLQIPPGDMSWFHTHEWPVFYVTLGTSQTRTQLLGEEWGVRGRGAAAGRAAGAGGDAAGRGPAPRGAPPSGRGPAALTLPRLSSDTSYVERPVTHRLQNIGSGLFRAMVVINETHGDDTTTEEAAGFTAKPEVANRWFRAYRIVLGPGEKTPSHEHNAAVAIVQATSGKGLGAGAMKFEFNEPGQWAFFDAGDRHEIANTGDARLELIEVEVRRK